MKLTNYYNYNQQQQIVFSREQACKFAKGIAGDFNAIHDADSSRFCVPGDLLFSVVLSKIGLSHDMTVRFSGMVSDGIALNIVTQNDQLTELVDDNGKTYLSFEHIGEHKNDPVVINQLVKDYVTFSGHNFPHILVPLLKEQGLMLNRKRPLVIYESMSIHFDVLDIKQPEIHYLGGEYTPNGKKGVATLRFEITEQGKLVGHGVKRMVLGTLLQYQAEESQILIDKYNAARDKFLAA